MCVRERERCPAVQTTSSTAVSPVDWWVCTTVNHNYKNAHKHKLLGNTRGVSVYVCEGWGREWFETPIVSRRALRLVIGSTRRGVNPFILGGGGGGGGGGELNFTGISGQTTPMCVCKNVQQFRIVSPESTVGRQFSIFQVSASIHLIVISFYRRS